MGKHKGNTNTDERNAEKGEGKCRCEGCRLLSYNLNTSTASVYAFPATGNRNTNTMGKKVKEELEVKAINCCHTRVSLHMH